MLACIVATSAILNAVTPEDFWTFKNQCAAWTVYQACKLRSVEIAEGDVDKQLPMNGQAKSMDDIRKALVALGVECHGRQMSLDEAATNAVPMVVCLTDSSRRVSHFCLVVGWSGKYAVVADGPNGAAVLSTDDLAPSWNREILLLARSPMSIWAAMSAGTFLVCLIILVLDQLHRSKITTRCRNEAMLAGKLVCVSLGISVSGCGGEAVSKASMSNTGARLASLQVKPDHRQAVQGIKNGTTYGGVAVFEIVNDTTQRVVLDKLVSTCGCTDAQISNQQLAPNERATVTARINGSTQTGASAEVILTWKSPDVAPTVLSISLQGNSNPPAFLGSAEIELGILDGDKGQFRIATVEKPGSSVWLHSVRSASQGVDLAISADKERFENRNDLNYRFYDIVLQCTSLPGSHLVDIDFLDRHSSVVARTRCRFSLAPLMALSHSSVTFNLPNRKAAFALKREVQLIFRAGTQRRPMPSIAGPIAPWLEATIFAAKNSTDQWTIVVSCLPNMLPSLSVESNLSIDSGIDGIPRSVLNVKATARE